MRGNDSNIIIVTEELKAFVGKFGLWVRKLERQSFYMITCLKDFVEENSMVTNNTDIDQCVEDHLANLQSSFLSIIQK
jgi:hypothetical protein